MDLISCKGCMVVLDVSEVCKNPICYYDYDEDEYDENYVAWDPDKKEYGVFVECPVCNNKIFIGKD